MRFLFHGRVRLTMLVAIAAGLTAGGIAYASIPDSGIIHGCYKKNKGDLRVIDPSAGGSCGPSETPLDWNQTGPTGLKGGTGPTGATGPTEGVNTVGTGPTTPPTTLTDQFDFPTPNGSTFTTTVSGKLFLSKPFDGSLDCPSGDSVWWWIVLDGTPVRGSLAFTDTGNTRLAQTLVGVTSSVISAGTHTMSVGGMCMSGSADSSSTKNYSGGTAIVLG
jgi:hypothetical protein